MTSDRLAWGRRGRLSLVALLVVAARCGGSPSRPTDQALPPQLTCPGDVNVQSSDRGPLTVSYPAPTLQNGTQPVSLNCQPASNSAFSPGPTSVRCLAIDAASRSAACAFTVTVIVQAPPPQLSVTRFVAFGDSITEGKVTLSSIGPLDDLPGSYPSTLRMLLPARYTSQQFEVFGEGKGGETAAQGALRLPDRLAADKPQVLLLLEGANDLTRGDATQVPVVVSSLQTMIQDARSRGVQVLVGTLLPERASGSLGGGAALIVPTNDQIKPMVIAQGAKVVDLYTAFAGRIDTLIGPDGLHPTSSGYDLIAQTFFEAIQKQFEIAPAPALVSTSRMSLH